MARISIPEGVNLSDPGSGGYAQKLINTAVSTWHAVIAGGAPVAVTTAFTDPTATEADRIPELALAGGGTPGDYVITGTWNGVAQTETITTVAGATVKGDLPFDTITSLTGPDPVNNLTLNKGDSYASPPARAIWTGSTLGNISVQLASETAVQTVSNIPAFRDWPRRAVRVGVTLTTLTSPYFVW
jgi:hypothetical protein